MKFITLKRNHSHRRTSSRDHQDPFLKRLLSDPYLGWLAMIIVSTTLAAVFVILGYSTYFDVKESLKAAPVSVIKTNIIFNSDSLSKILIKINERDKTRQSIIQGSVRVSDPSL